MSLPVESSFQMTKSERRMTTQIRLAEIETFRSVPLYGPGLRHSFVIRYSCFVIFPLHLLRHLDSKKFQPALQNSPGKIAQGQTRTARRFLRLQDGASFVECVEAVGQFEQIICQNVWAKPIQHLWNYFSEPTQTFRQIQFGGVGKRKARRDRKSVV